MSLTLYKKKRDFKKTPEPISAKAGKGHSLSFVVQKHAASHLHYDFRLEMEGVLKSWAVPKGPSMKAGEKRLAVQVEDHPLPYGKFFGEIPKGNYGAGIVEIWDNGTYKPVDKVSAGDQEKLLLAQLKKGDIKFILKGKYLNGTFALVRMHGQEKNWLLIKKEDGFSEKDFHIEKIKPIKPFSINGNSKAHTAKKIETRPSFAKASEDKIKKVKPIQPSKEGWKGLEKPMLAKLSPEIKDDPDWLYEMKYDGYRAITRIKNGKAEMISRNGNSFNKLYSPLVKELEKIKEEVVLDGEVVIENEEGLSDFQLLQNYTTTKKGNLKYFVFDILFLNGHRLTDLPLRDRKELLDAFFQNFTSESIIRSDHVTGKGEKLFASLSKKGYEGIIAKNMSSPYSPGKRSGSWLKIKMVLAQEAVICGYTEPGNNRKYFGSLILGLYDHNKLKYIGNCGTGFTEASLKELHEQLEELITGKCPFDSEIRMAGNKGKAVWLEPKLVCHVKFLEWTEDGRMRNPVFMGLRIDKKPNEVMEEEISTENNSKKDNKKRVNGPDEAEIRFGNKKVKCTNLNKIYFPYENITKGDLINYYKKISGYILPYLKDRPLSLNRHPNGITGSSFYQKDMNVKQLPEWVKTVKLYSKSTKKYIHYLICNDEATLIYIANLGCIEINPWHSTYEDPDKPNYIIMDLDPGKIDFTKVADTALMIKNICDELKIRSYCKTSGSRGLHIYIPLDKSYDYDSAKAFAESIAKITHERLSKTTSIERPLNKRTDKIYIDFLQNRKGQTIAAPYCVRPRPHATVSTPLLWDEVDHKLSPEMFTIFNIEKRLKKKGDIWKDVIR